MTSRGVFRGVTSLTLQTIMLIALQITVLAVIWFINPLGPEQTDTFALFLSVDLLSFAIISYQYRRLKDGARPDGSWLALGYFALVVLLASNLMMI